MSRNYGDQFVDSVREYLKANELEKVNWTLMADLAQRFQEKFAGSQKTRKKKLCEDEWIKGLEADPTWTGIDIRRELGKCQAWCKEHSKICTRPRFVNWLLKAEPTIGKYAGDSSRPRPVVVRPTYTPDTVVPGWPLLLRREVKVSSLVSTDEEYMDLLCAGDWHELPLEIRTKIIAVA